MSIPEIFILLMHLITAKSVLSQTIQRSFRIANIPRTTWIAEENFGSSNRGYCTFLCLTNLDSCKAFTINDQGHCEFGTLTTYVPLSTETIGFQIYIVDKDATVEQQTIDLTKTPHMAYLSLANGQVDFSLNSTMSPPIVLPQPHPDIRNMGTSINFYRSGVFYVCAAMDFITHSPSKNCYSWSIGEASYVKEVNTMLYQHAAGATVDMGDKIWVTGGNDPAVQLLRTYTEFWRAGKWYPGPNLPVASFGHNIIQLSGNVAMFIPGNGPNGNSNTWTYDFTTDVWAKKANYPSNAIRYNRAAAVMTMADGKKYVACVGGYDFSKYYTQMDLYDIVEDKWSLGPPMLVAMSGATAVVVAAAGGEDKFWLFGGALSYIPSYNYNQYLYSYTASHGWKNEGILGAAGAYTIPVLYNI